MLDNLNTMDWLPWAIIGVLVVIGGTTALVAGMPWLTKREADLRDQMRDKEMTAIRESLALTTTLCNANATQIAQLTTNVAVLTAEVKGIC